MKRRQRSGSSVKRPRTAENDYDKAFRLKQQRAIENAIISTNNRLRRRDRLRRMGKSLRDVYIPKTITPDELTTEESSEAPQ